MMTQLQVATDTTLVPVGHDGSLLDLFTQAGGFQWPILAVLLAGLMTLTLAGVRLFSDHYAARKVRGLRVHAAEAMDLNAIVRGSDDSLYRRLLAGMLQVWHTAPDPAALGQESGTVLEAARAAYGRTQRMVGFFSSTAGGLGLPGNAGRDLRTLFGRDARRTNDLCRNRYRDCVDAVGDCGFDHPGAARGAGPQLGQPLYGACRRVGCRRAVSPVGTQVHATRCAVAAMQHTLIVRLVDITLLLLLSLMAIASIDPFAVEPPRSEAIEERGVMLQPLQVAITAEGTIQILDEAGQPEAHSAEEAAVRLMGTEGGIEVIADHRAPPSCSCHCTRRSRPKACPQHSSQNA